MKPDEVTNVKPPLISAGARVILVGNGPSLMKKKLGHVIDEFDEVLRFNRFRCAGFEQHTGSKTTIYCTFGQGSLPGDEGQRPAKAILRHESSKCAYEVAWTYPIPRSYFGALSGEIKAATKMPNLRKIIPSSGYLVARWLLDNGLTEKVTLTGFDHFSKATDKRHHYWLAKAFGKPQEHDGDYEGSRLAEYRKQGRLEYLNSIF